MFSCLYVTIPKYTKVITRLVYYTNKKNFDSVNQNLYKHSKLISFIIMYTEIQIFMRMHVSLQIIFESW